MYNFDEIIDRRNTSCAKYDSFSLYGKSENLLPLWVADMDFRTADPVRERIKHCAEHGIFGYGHVQDQYYEALSNWFEAGFNFPVDRHWVVFTPGVVFALSAAIRAFTKEGDAVIINQPVYYPFANLILNNNRKLVNSNLILDNGHYSIDFDDFEKKISENNVKMYLLCSPHNPVGRVWTKDELLRLGEICLAHDVIVVSDEIHCDFVWSPHPHTIFASLGEKFMNKCIVCTAPSKTFNLAGLQASNIIIPDRKLRQAFRKTVFDTGYSELNVIAAAACEAAYTRGLPWLDELRAYIKENINYTQNYIHDKVKKVHMIQPEGTYLIWLDLRELTLTEKELENLITDKANLWLDGGSMFGEAGSGFQRINAACPKSTLRQALIQLKSAIDSI